ncbi:MAG: hypothetical protein K8R90_05240 [Candidatus Cloacimonetes bacterium]|nr:hypothetical protein [Candidatus Cloacimonadota bacterium]
MGLFNRKKISKAELPPQGRSSAEPLEQSLSSVLAVLDGRYANTDLWRTLRTLELLAIHNADISHAIRNWIKMANTGHNVTVSGGSSRANQQALDELNHLAATLYDSGAGIDGLVNHYLQQIAVTGAVSSEDVLADNLKGVVKVVPVRVAQVRFKYEDGAWQPYQHVHGKQFKLNLHTYRYYAHLRLEEDKPYAKPMFIAALEAVIRQKDMHENIGYIMQKYGLVGFVEMMVSAPPRKKTESETEHQARLKDYLADVAKAASGAYRNGMMVHYDDQTVKHNSMSAVAAGGAKDIYQLNEEQVFSGIGIDPAMQGRSYSTTETYAGVVYGLLAAEARGLQRLVKRRLERTYRLHLALTGREQFDVSVAFNPVAEKDPKASAEREQIELNNVLAKVRAGLIDPDAAAQELGYDGWHDHDLAIAQFDPMQQAFAATAPRPFDRATRPFVGAAAGDGDAEANDRDWYALAESYLRRMRPHLRTAEQDSIDQVVAWMRTQDSDPGLDEFQRQSLALVQARLGELGDDGGMADEIATACAAAYEAARFTASDSREYGAIDTRITAFAAANDRFFVSSYATNPDYERGMLRWMQQTYEDNGANLWKRMDDDTLAAFREQFSEALGKASDAAARRIVNTTVQTMRNFGNIAKLSETGVSKLEIYEPLQECAICKEMHGKVVETEVARTYIEQASDMSPGEYVDHLRARSGRLSDTESLRSVSFKDAVAEGYGTPPYHPNCKGRVIKHREALRKVEGQDVNAAENGREFEFVNAETGEKLTQHVEYTVLDRRGQKVIVTRETLAHDSRGLAEHIPGILYQGEMYVDNRRKGTIAYVIGDMMVVTRQSGEAVGWTVLKMGNPSSYLRNNFSPIGGGQ